MRDRVGLREGVTKKILHFLAPLYSRVVGKLAEGTSHSLEFFVQQTIVTRKHINELTSVKCKSILLVHLLLC